MPRVWNGGVVIDNGCGSVSEVGIMYDSDGHDGNDNDGGGDRDSGVSDGNDGKGGRG